MRRIRITFSYDGAAYYGWQIQPGLPTVQAAVEAVISNLEGSAVKVEASGRTDAGVHALAQVAAFTIENPIPPGNLVHAMNRQLPGDIRLLDAAETHETFHPRHDAIAKTYEYRILRAEICPPFDRLEGEHDFSCYATSDDSDALGRSKVRTVFSSKFYRDGDRLIYRVRGSGFLKHMVRNMVGVLLEVGKGNLAPTDLFVPRDPGPTAPARGLFLISVEYPESVH